VTEDRRSAVSLFRRFRLGSGPLKRGSDRLQVLARVLLVSALLTAVPVALAVGTATHSRMLDEAADQAATRLEVTARLTEDAHSTSGSDNAAATVSWTGPSGELREAVVPVAPSAREGSTVSVWVDADGQRTGRPLTDADVTVGTVGHVVWTLLGIWFVAVAGYCSFRRMLDRHRLRRWTEEWAAVGPVWSRTVL
jgi:hypothetical protein